ncbi:uncharacterized protein [Diadema antillarum]|uniref:uncharacterized protein n=1 Tax=Diadema antillarum TaxID=105358 RepID=UPI003A8C3D0E
MVSTLNKVFRNLIGSETHQSTSRSKKRPSESLDDVTQDVLETPRPKRARTSNHTDDLTNSRESTPLVKVATWIKKKATSFGENYFFRPVEHFMERSYPEHVGEPGVENNHRQPHAWHSSHAAVSHAAVPSRSNNMSTQNKGKNTSGPVSFKEPAGEPPHRKHLSSSTNITSNKSPVPVLHNGHHEEQDDLDWIRGGISAVKPQESLSNISKSNSQVTARGPIKPESYVPVKDKLFPGPTKRKVVSHTSRGRPHLPNSKLTARECVRLKERQEYQNLLQQFSKDYSSGVTSTSTLQGPDTRPRAPSTVTQQTGARPKAPELSRTSAANQRSSFGPSTQTSQLGTRVLPHQFSTQREIREAVRQRIHAPASHLSPGTPSGERAVAATPAQPDFNESESPVQITSVRSPPKTTPMSAFQRSLCATPYLADDWFKDLKSRFESSVRIKQREIDEQHLKVKLYAERRAKGQAEAQEIIKARISQAEKEPGVVEDVIYRVDEKVEEEEEDVVEVIDEDEEEEELEEEDEEEEGEEDEEEEGEGEEFAELTLEMDEEIERAFHPNPSQEALVSGFRLTITRRDMQTLRGLNWLNDEVMNFYFELLMERSNTREEYPTLHYFNTFFYPKLVNSGYNSIRRWTKRTDIFAKDMVLVPVHLGMHWCLAVIDFRDKSISFFDSMGSQNQQCLDALRDYVVSEHADKKKQEYSMEGWTYQCPRDIPQQLNGSDCGMFACKYAEYVSRDAPITFTQHDMPYFRRRMVWEILHKTLL